MPTKVTLDAEAEVSPQSPTHGPFQNVCFAMGQPLLDLDKATALAAELEEQELIARLKPHPKPTHQRPLRITR